MAGIAEILKDVESALKKDVADKRTARDEANAEKPAREASAAEAAEKLAAKTAETHSLKVALAAKATAFRVARSSLAEAEEARDADGQNAREAEKKKGAFVGAMEKLTSLKTATPEQDSDTRKQSNDLMTLLKKYKFEESMMIAIPSALAKAPDARGAFDLMAIDQLATEIQKFIAEQDAILTAAAPGKAKCEAAVKEAQDALAASRGEQRLAAKAYDAASGEMADCTTNLSAAQKAVKENTTLLKRLERIVNTAEAEVELFEQGPCESFKELRARSTPAEPEGAEAEQGEAEMEEVTAMMADEAVAGAAEAAVVEAQ